MSLIHSCAQVNRESVTVSQHNVTVTWMTCAGVKCVGNTFSYLCVCVCVCTYQWPWPGIWPSDYCLFSLLLPEWSPPAAPPPGESCTCMLPWLLLYERERVHRHVFIHSHYSVVSHQGKKRCRMREAQLYFLLVLQMHFEPFFSNILLRGNKVYIYLSLSRSLYLYLSIYLSFYVSIYLYWDIAPSALHQNSVSWVACYIFDAQFIKSLS